jgi:hypothetical protein
MLARLIVELFVFVPDAEGEMVTDELEDAALLADASAEEALDRDEGP